MSKQLLLVVDVQNGFVNPNSKHIVKPLVRFIEQWQKNPQGLVIYSRFVNLDNSPWEKLMGWKSLKTEPETALDPRLPTKSAEIFKKGTYSAWSKEVQQICDGAGIKEVVLCGIDTDQCVMETAIDIFESNLRPIVITDLCASSAGQSFHEAGIKLMNRLIGEDQMLKQDQL